MSRPRQDVQQKPPRTLETISKKRVLAKQGHGALPECLAPVEALHLLDPLASKEELRGRVGARGPDAHEPRQGRPRIDRDHRGSHRRSQQGYTPGTSVSAKEQSR